MKNKIVLFISLLILNFTFSGSKKEEVRKILSVNDSISIFCTPDLYNLTVKWASEFCSLNPDVKIRVLNTTGASVTENSDIRNNTGFISSEYSAVYDESMWNVVVGRDVIVLIFNSKNPFVYEICQQGISSEKFAQIFANPEMKNWGTLLNNRKKVPVNLYFIDNESINAGMAKLLNLDQITIDGIKVENGKELISSVQKDPYSVGICKITNIPDLNDQSIAESIKLLPIDRNGNGKIDYMEKVYDDLNVLSRGVWIGKYPKTLFSNIYFISPFKPTNKIEVAFLKWVLTDGQQFLYQYGYNDLLLSERQTKIELISDSKIDIVASNNNYATSKMILLILASFAVIVFSAIKGISYIKKKKVNGLHIASISTNAFNEDFVDIPMGLYFDKTHTWAFMEKDGMVRVGIDDFLQHITGPLTRVKMKSTGERIRKGKQALSIVQNGKQLNIYAPVSGTIKEQNKSLDTNSSIINSSPYSDGWVYRIEPTNWLKEIQYLIIGNKYKEWIKSEFSRLKEFITVSINPDTIEYAHVLQDGGELKDRVLMDLGPEVWEDFQTNFIDVSI
ncbi:MAG: hypothetical protein EPN88_10765 [Bacteroidetes bacterium]|nr:MAG: hypothetical protein EPN88_10765 [Bacteroidota bacterium]